MDGLKERGVQAIFFVTGQHVELQAIDKLLEEGYNFVTVEEILFD